MHKHYLLVIRLLILGIAFVFVTGAEPAYAFRQDWGGVEDDWSMPTATGGGTPNDPTIRFCYANKSDKQKCRGCTDTYYDNGMKKPYQVCGWLEREAACDCKNANTANCENEGACAYFPLR